jgi:hypothetical protein
MMVLVSLLFVFNLECCRTDRILHQLRPSTQLRSRFSDCSAENTIIVQYGFF